MVEAKQFDVDQRTGVVLSLPGMTLNGSIFPRFALPTIDVEFTTVSLDGGSRRPPRGREGMRRYVGLLDERLEREGSWRSRPRIVVAHSFGGMLALSWLIENRCGGNAAIDGLVLIATSGGPMFDDVRLRAASWRGRDLTVGLTRLVHLWNTRPVTWLTKRIMTGGRLEVHPVDFAKLDDRSDKAIDAAGWRNTDWRAMRSFRSAMIGLDLRSHLHRVTVPTIVLHGDADTIFPVDVGARLAAALPKAELRVVPGAAHALSLTHPEEVTRAVLDLRRGSALNSSETA